MRYGGNQPTRGNFTIAAIGVKFAPQQRKQAGLTAAVGADQTDAPARMNLQRRVFDQAPGAAREREVAKLNHGLCFEKRAF